MSKGADQGRLLVVGNVTEDLSFQVPHLPNPGETLISDAQSSELGGKGLNQAVIAARCGVAVSLVAPLGHDPVAEKVRALVDSENLDANFAHIGGRTDQSVISVSRSGENTIISSALAADSLDPATVVPSVAGFGAGDALLVQGNLSLETTRAVLNAACDRGVTTYANLSPIRWDWEGLCPLVGTAIVNRFELATLSSLDGTEDGLKALLVAGCSRVLVTLGPDGAILVDGVKRWDQPAISGQVVDTAGAGDTFCGVFVAREILGDGPKRALLRAAENAAITVSRHGTLSAFPDSAQLAAYQ